MLEFEFSEFVYSVRKLCEILRDRSDVLGRDEELDELVEEIEQQLDEYASHEEEIEQQLDEYASHEEDENLD